MFEYTFEPQTPLKAADDAVRAKLYLRQLCAERGLGLARFAELQAAVEIARRQMSETLRAGPSLASPRATRDFLSSQLRDLEHEVFCCLYLDKRHRLIQFQELFTGRKMLSAGDLQICRYLSGGNHDVPSLQCFLPDLYGCWTGEASATTERYDAGFRKLVLAPLCHGLRERTLETH